jgi:hypothetical protein
VVYYGGTETILYTYVQCLTYHSLHLCLLSKLPSPINVSIVLHESHVPCRRVLATGGGTAALAFPPPFPPPSLPPLPPSPLLPSSFPPSSSRPLTTVLYPA